MERSGATPTATRHDADVTRVLEAAGPFATVHLGTPAAVPNAAQESLRRWSTVRGALLSEGAPESVVDAIEPVVEEAHLKGESLLAVSSRDGLLLVDHLGEPPPHDQAWWSALPRMTPLLVWRQSAPPHVVVQIDRRGADIVGARLYGPDLHVEAGVDDLVEKNAPGGWSQRRYQQRAENTWEENAGDVATEVVRLVERIGARLVVVTGDVRAVTMLREALPPEVLALLEEVEGGRGQDGSDPLEDEHVERLVRSVAARETVEALELFRQELGQHDRAVEGVDATLDALRKAQVDVLLVHDDPDDERQTWIGEQPVQVGERHAVEALGGSPTEARLVDAAIRAALGTGAGVRVVPRGGGPRDGMGALLRWT